MHFKYHHTHVICAFKYVPSKVIDDYQCCLTQIIYDCKSVRSKVIHDFQYFQSLTQIIDYDEDDVGGLASDDHIWREEEEEGE